VKKKKNLDVEQGQLNAALRQLPVHLWRSKALGA